LKNLTLKELSQVRVGRSARAAMAFFGKHPAFADFVPRIGAETETLVRTKQILLSGLEEQKRQWEELGPEKLLQGFDHWFLWLRRKDLLFGLLWNSKDAVGREDAAGVCIDAKGVTTHFVISELRPALEKLQTSLQESKEVGRVESSCQSAREELKRLVANALLEDVRNREAQKLFLERPEFGPERQGWLRILHALRSVLKGTPGPRTGVCVHLRVPLGTASRSESLRLWTEFLRHAVPSGASILAISRNGCSWLDLIVGEPAPKAFRCLQADTTLIPLTTQIPYDVDAKLPDEWSRIETRWLAAREGNMRGRFGLAAAILVVVSLAGGLLVLMRRGPEQNPEGPDRKNVRMTPIGRSATPVQSNQTQPIVQSALPVTNAVLAAVTNLVASPTNRQTPDTGSKGPPDTKAQVESKPTPEPPPNPELEKALTSARQAEKTGDFTNALALFWAAQKLNPGDANLLDHIKDLTPKAQEQNRLAQQQARNQEIIEGEFRKAMDSAAANAAAGNYSNALAGYQGALKIKGDPAAQAGIAAMQQKIQEASDRDLKQQQEARQFEDALALARKAEDAKDYDAALAAYQSAQAIRKEDSQVADRIKALTSQIEEQKRAEAARIDLARKEEERFRSAIAAGKASEQAGDFTNALSSYKVAQQMRPTDTELSAYIEEVSPKAEQQAKLAAEKNKESRLPVLDSQLESLMVNFGLLKRDEAKTVLGSKAQYISGVLSMKDLNNYLGAVAKMEAEYKSGGWLSQDQRAEKIKKLINTIQNRN